MEDLRLIRLTATRDLLLTTALTLKEIAPRCGLGDEFHLARLFSRHFKIPPGAVRRKRSRTFIPLSSAKSPRAP